jgi:hypothetical protein
LKVTKETVSMGALENKVGIGLLPLCPGNQPVGFRSGGIGLAKMTYDYSEPMPILKFSSPIADTGVDKDHRPTLKRVPG